MSGVDILGCLGAIVSAFHGASGLLQTIIQRNERRRRMNGVAQDADEAFEEKMLLRSLSDGESQCKSARDEKYKRYGAAFKQGDIQSLSALKDVMVSLQMDIISALQVAQAVANAKLDLCRLHEAAIVNKREALRAVEELCTRILPIVELEGSIAADAQRIRSESHGEIRMTGVDRPLAVTLPMTPPSSPPAPPAAVTSPRPSSHTRIQSQPLPQARTAPAKKRGGLARMFSSISQSLSMANDDYGAFQRTLQAERTETLKEAKEERTSADPNEMARHYTHDSGFGGSETSSRRRTTPSVASTLPSEDRDSAVSENHSKTPDGTPRSDSDTIPSIAVFPDAQNVGRSGILQLDSRSSAHSSRLATTVLEESDIQTTRARLVPGAATTSVEPMLAVRPSSKSNAALTRELGLSGIHPAFRQESDREESVETDFHGPAEMNVFRNFCQGAQQIRERTEDGLSVVIMSPQNSSPPVSYVRCKQCEFRTRTTNKSMPDYLYILASGIRFRWIFLARSHMCAETFRSKVEAYTYGCIFCAAEGHETAVHANLDALMSHIGNKHKTSMMTPEVRAKTKCLVGGMPEDVDDWEIDLPQSSKKGKLGLGRK